VPVVVALAGRVSADSVRVTGPTDYWFHYTEQRVFSARTFSVDGYWSDPMLWLFTADGVLLAQNDDWYGLQSRLEVPLQAGSYRLRAGVCCGNPDQWWQGVRYDLWTADVAVAATSTTVALTTTEPSTTTTPQTTTTEVASTTTSVAVTTTTVEPSTTSTSVVQSTTTVEQTTTVPVIVSTTWLPPTTTSFPTLTTFGTTTTVAAPTTTSTVYEQTTTVPAPPATTTTQPAPPVTPLRTSTTTSLLPSTTTSTLPPTTTTEPDRGPVPVVTVPPVVTPENVADIAQVVEDLTPEQVEELVLVLNTATAEVKKEFEEEVNVFAGGFDNYVPADSKIPVGERRVLVAIGATTLATAGAVRRKN
jgi:hypothetical protein